MAAMKRLLSWFLAAFLLLGGVLQAGALPAEGTAAEGSGETSGAPDSGGSSDAPLFSAYLAEHADAARPAGPVEVDVLHPSSHEGGEAPRVETVDGVQALVTDE